MSVKIKICGLTSREAVDEANQLAIDFAGFVFFPPSPRHLSYEQAALLAAQVAPSIERVALLVDADDLMIEHVMQAVEPHRLQLHGTETPDRIKTIKQNTGRPIIKSIVATNPEHIKTAHNMYQNVADWFLYDAPPPPQSDRPGGNAAGFNWNILQNSHPPRPWFLAGGLNAKNLSQAILQTDADMVDVSSSVEVEPGKKDPILMRQFVEAARRIG